MVPNEHLIVVLPYRFNHNVFLILSLQGFCKFKSEHPPSFCIFALRTSNYAGIQEIFAFHYRRVAFSTD